MNIEKILMVIVLALLVIAGWVTVSSEILKTGSRNISVEAGEANKNLGCILSDFSSDEGCKKSSSTSPKPGPTTSV